MDNKFNNEVVEAAKKSKEAYLNSCLILDRGMFEYYADNLSPDKLVQLLRDYYRVIEDNSLTFPFIEAMMLQELQYITHGTLANMSNTAVVLDSADEDEFNRNNTIYTNCGAEMFINTKRRELEGEPFAF